MTAADAEVVRTFRSGPSDPVRFEDGPGTWVEIDIAASADDVWPLVSDPNLPERFSDEFLGARWVDGGPALGAAFVGRNRHPAAGEWETTSYVDVFEPPHRFGWAVSDVDNPGARWWFDITPVVDGVRLRFEVTIGPGPSGQTMAIAAMPDKEARILHRRVSELNANMRRTVEGIRDLVEER